METCFIDHNAILALLEETREIPEKELFAILDKAGKREGLSYKEVAALLNARSDAVTDKLYQTAKVLKEEIYGQRVVIFAPLYVSDYCVNNCSYCGFKCVNRFQRKKLTMTEIQQEVAVLEKMGHKRIALEAGEDPVNCSLNYILEAVETIYAMKFENGSIRRINVNIAAASVEDYRRLKEAGIGTYILFQETYHRPTYESVHLGGPKNNYRYHAYAFDRAMEAGIDDVGGGALFGLYDPAYEVMGLVMHNGHLEKTYGTGFHTVSMPRIRKAEGATEETYPYAVDDQLFKKLTAILRLAIPYAGIIISTRETPEMRKQLINLGVSQISAGSAVEVGGYQAQKPQDSQFQLEDSRPAREILLWLMEEGFIPSFCTACYRQGRTGDRFMDLAKSGHIKNVCLPNALMTLKEYSLDYGNKKFTALAQKLIQEKLPQIKSPPVKALIQDNLTRIEKGERDLFL